MASLHSRLAQPGASPELLLPAFLPPSNGSDKLPNGPDDGGLTVMTGTAPLFEQYFKEHQPVSLRSYATFKAQNSNE